MVFVSTFTCHQNREWAGPGRIRKPSRRARPKRRCQRRDAREFKSKGPTR